jgi:RNA polymerase sigma factor (sigma-70 family)
MSLSQDQPADQWGRLMRAAQDGDKAAYTRLLTEIAPHIRMLVRRQWPDGAEGSEDLVQEVLLSVHQVRHTYDSDRPFAPWLGTIIRRRMADRARRFYRRTANEMAVDVLPETSSLADTNDRQDTVDDVDAMMRAIKELPKGQRQAIELLKLQEMSLKEASMATGMSIGALKVAVHRAVKALKLTVDREKS